MIDPELKKKFQRFRQIRRGYYSFLIIAFLTILSLGLEVLVSNRAVVVHFDGKTFFPTYTRFHPGTDFGLSYGYETNYHELKKKIAETPEWQERGDFVLLPIVPYSASEIALGEDEIPPTPPDRQTQHFLGTDLSGRDVLARLCYGYRVTIFFAFLILLLEYLVGVTLGCAMGYFGGWFDMIMQRMIEIWTNIPFLYVIIIMSAIFQPSFFLLVGIMIFFGWTSMTWYMRTETYREKSRDYVLAARTVGASHFRIMIRHILPNTLAVIITFIPFSINGSIAVLVSLDFLGFGLPAGTPSFGNLLQQGLSRLDKLWIIGSVLVAMISLLTMITFVGEAIREAFDPKKLARYE